MPPIIFLDVDDVLVVSQQYGIYQVIAAVNSTGVDAGPDLWAGLVLPEARENLAALHCEFFPRYVVASNWSKSLTRGQMQQVFCRTGLEFVADHLHPHWTTPKGVGSPRITEIEGWLAKHRQPGQALLVLDDHESGWNMHDSHLDRPGHVVLCTPSIGFVREKLQLAQQLLGAQTRL